MCLKHWDLNQEQLLQASNVASLSDRRTHAKLSHFYKIVNELADYPDAPLYPKYTAIMPDKHIPGNLSSKELKPPSFKDPSFQTLLNSGTHSLQKSWQHLLCQFLRNIYCSNYLMCLLFWLHTRIS